MLIILGSRATKIPAVTERPAAILTRETWDDYGYRTTFTVTLYLPNEVVELGFVNILHADQVKGATPMPADPVEELGPNFCSLGGEIGYYERLLKCGRQVWRDYLKAMSDVVFSQLIRAHFEDKEGYKVSLLRGVGKERMVVDMAKLFTGPARVKSTRRGTGFLLPFKTRVATDATPFVITFDFKMRSRLPHRVNVVIGYNGTGKTALLSNLAMATSGYGYSDKQDVVDKSAGRFIGDAPPFKTVVVISYSAFDTFAIPGRSKIEKSRLKSEGGILGYVYCGLREHVADPLNAPIQYRLRTPQEIESDFLEVLSRVRSADRLGELFKALKPLLQDASFLRIGLVPIVAGQIDGELIILFRNLSSGHKIVLKIVADLVAHMDASQPNLVLIDEPETHLHPPLLAALLKSVRICLDLFDGYAVIATHSPVVLQETPSRFVHVMRRTSSDTRVDQTGIETFGENVGVITQDTFNLTESSADWHDTLRQLAKTLSIDEIENLFARRLGFAARSYIASLKEE